MRIGMPLSLSFDVKIPASTVQASTHKLIMYLGLGLAHARLNALEVCVEVERPLVQLTSGHLDETHDGIFFVLMRYPARCHTKKEGPRNRKIHDGSKLGRA